MNGYEVLIAWFLTVLLSTLSIITLTLVKSEVKVKPDIELAKRFIDRLCDGYYQLSAGGNTTNTDSEYTKRYNYDYLLKYLSIHLVKYNDGKLPLQPGTIIYTGEHCQYTLNFYNATDERIVKYIKAALKLLNFKKFKSVIEQCEDVIKATPKKRVRRVKQLVNV
jgi:hypothetical protein